MTAYPFLAFLASVRFPFSPPSAMGTDLPVAKEISPAAPSLEQPLTGENPGSGRRWLQCSGNGHSLARIGQALNGRYGRLSSEAVWKRNLGGVIPGSA